LGDIEQCAAASSSQLDQHRRDGHNRGEVERQQSNFERRHGCGLKTSIQENTARLLPRRCLLTVNVPQWARQLLLWEGQLQCRIQNGPLHCGNQFQCNGLQCNRAITAMSGLVL
jgi:hypothetical protein